jgi:hypothetical protein
MPMLSIAALAVQATVLASTSTYLAGDTPMAAPSWAPVSANVVQSHQRALEEGRLRPRRVPGWVWSCSGSERLLVCRVPLVGVGWRGDAVYRSGHGKSTTLVTIRRVPIR